MKLVNLLDSNFIKCKGLLIINVVNECRNYQIITDLSNLRYRYIHLYNYNVIGIDLDSCKITVSRS